MAPIYSEKEGEGPRSSSAAANRGGGDSYTPPASVPNSIHSGAHSGSKSTVGSLPTSISEAGSAHHEPDGHKQVSVPGADVNQGHVYPDEQPEITSNEVLGETIRPPVYSPVIESPPTPPRPTFPQLSNNPPASPRSRAAYMTDDKDEESSVPKPFDRSDKRHFASTHGAKKEIFEKDEGIRRMYKFTLYETTMRYYIVGSDLQDSRFRILKIDRTAEMGDLSIIEDEVEYTRDEMSRLLATIEDGNIINGGLKHRCPFWGLLGFIRFTGAYYMLLITKRSIVATIGGHYIYQIDNTEMVHLTTSSVNPKKTDHTPEEARFIHILGNLDLSRSFYFSYSYDITHTLQYNITRERRALAKGLPHPGNSGINDMFAWNNYLLQPAIRHIGKNTFDWCLPIIHGFVDQATISVYGRQIYITVIARRSRHFAGARFLKRGANDLGYVANDVETEQIVSEMQNTSFHASGGRLYSNPNYTSYVQHRGSIPLFWTQENNPATPKPPIELNLIDPFFSAAALHFDNMFQRYGTPIIVLNLVKARERVARESILLKEFTQAITYLNQFLPKKHRIQYIAWDMSRASKSRDQDVIETLEEIADQVLKTTGFFHNGYNPEKPSSMQNGVCRTNCIDCLDRTNAAQFVVGKRALGHQLHALGVIDTTSIEYDTDAVNLFTHMFRDHGDTIAVQYAGSHLVNTMETYRKINQWTSHSRDMLESFKRYYNNSFLDAQRQEAINLFLGNYVFVSGQPMLWDLTTDYYLHHMDPREGKRRRSYIKWWTSNNLQKRIMPDTSHAIGKYAGKPFSFFDDYWLEYYRPRAYSPLDKVFSYNLNSAFRYIPIKMTQEGKYDLSPFRVRVTYADSISADPAKRKKRNRKSVKIALQIEDGASAGRVLEEVNEDDKLASLQQRKGHRRQSSLTMENHLKKFAFSWVGGSDTGSQQQQDQQQQDQQQQDQQHQQQQCGDSGTQPNSLNTFPKLFPQPLGSPTKSFSFSSATTTPGPKHQPLPPLEDLVLQLLSPSVSPSDADEYSRYMSHPLNLPLVTSSTAEPPSTIPSSSSPQSTRTTTTRSMSSGTFNSCSTTTSSSISAKKPLTQPTPTTQQYSHFYNYVNMPNLGVDALVVKDDDVALYNRFIKIKEEKNVLGVEVEGEDGLGLGGGAGGAGGGLWKKRYKAYQTWLTTGRLKHMGGGGGNGGRGNGDIVTGGNAAGHGWFAPDVGIAGGLSQAMGTRIG
ncbi:hypothetical protein L211DRAFT_864066 [Terfezia boudieri ATCC MYA-4762]|uniref:SAC domain-containing protein n=1 Tax=Terfezia boudieri ATCC MYA-4762 TaxID=1051890 RepID=A0A3N4MAA6_9PEZI|nr:hypothetical protein L211DRAFT_864066 [Terfezia boudieri ATCC MYA-4762]